MDLYPAIDLRGGHCVRLFQGDFAQETSYGDDAVGLATGFAKAGAPWVHVVDLDAARTGVPRNRTQIEAIARTVDVKLQSGGGVRDVEAAEGLLSIGVDRVVIGTAAMEDPAFVRYLASAHPGRVAVGLDARHHPGATSSSDRWEVAVNGWVKGSGQDLFEAAKRFEDAGVAALVVTEIGRDGTMEGPDLGGLAKVLEVTSLDVIASGGVGSIDDIRALADLRVGGRSLAGAIVGRALYEERFVLADALAASTR